MRGENETSMEQERIQLSEELTKANLDFMKLEGEGLPTKEAETDIKRLSRRLL